MPNTPPPAPKKPNVTVARQSLLNLGFPEREIALMTPQQIVATYKEYELMMDQVD